MRTYGKPTTVNKQGCFWPWSTLQASLTSHRESKVNKQAPPIARFCQDLGAV